MGDRNAFERGTTCSGNQTCTSVPGHNHAHFDTSCFLGLIWTLLRVGGDCRDLS